jgi:hypoxanthine-guanine phosphoribosyltransferase
MKPHDLKINKFSLHKFEDRKSITFSANDYSKLKYGSGNVGKSFGVELANGFFAKHYDLLISKQIVVTESAYQSMKNAASMITDAFINTLNKLLSEMNGNFIHRIKISRNVPYIQDYGKVSLKQRVKLLEKDTFTLDKEYVKDKFIIFIDDILITGTHQKKIEEMVDFYELKHDNCMCVYYAELLNPYEDPSIEAFLNNSEIKTLHDLEKLIQNDSDYKIIVRTAKMILSWKNTTEVKELINTLTDTIINELYYNCLSEGYYKNPAYSKNFSILQDKFNML